MLYADQGGEPMYRQIRDYLRCKSTGARCGSAPSKQQLNQSIRDSMNLYLSDAGIGKRPYFVEVTLEGSRVLLVEREVNIAISRAGQYENAVTRVKLPVYLPNGDRGSIEIYVELGGMEVVVE
ncbi:MAG: hypothetical protein SVU32_02465 [Candidatus Nanohaloarchaea archaeon]|nr:hypothetical protein [Candidatus Nanohaloarchaea archaeon]